MAEALKVPKEPFEAVIRRLLNMPPMPMSDIPRKRAPKAKKRKTKRSQ